MQIVCPHCGTNYQIADAAIGANGRSVRCVRCQTIWHAALSAAPDADTTAVETFQAELGTPPQDDATPAPSSGDGMMSETPEPAPEDGAAEAAPAGEGTRPLALSDIPIPVERVPLQPGGPPPAPIVSLEDAGAPDIESVAARRARAAARKGRNRWRVPVPIAIAALILLCAGLLGMRKDMVRHVPQLASFYSAIGLPVNLRGMVFADMKIGNEIHDGVPVLVIEGMIVSTTSKPVDVPRLRFALRNAAGAEIYSWTAQPIQPVLAPFETMPFRSRLASPPAEGHDIQVRFFTSRDAVASLR